MSKDSKYADAIKSYKDEHYAKVMQIRQGMSEVVVAILEEVVAEQAKGGVQKQIDDLKEGNKRLAYRVG